MVSQLGQQGGHSAPGSALQLSVCAAAVRRDAWESKTLRTNSTTNAVTDSGRLHVTPYCRQVAVNHRDAVPHSVLHH